MTRGTMRTLARLWGLDKSTATFTNADINIGLNEAARFVARRLARVGRINYVNGTESFTSTATATAYALSATTISRIYKMVELDSSSRVIAPCDQINELLEMTENAVSWDGSRWRYFPTRHATTKVWSINFPSQISAGHTFSVEYVTRTTEISVGTANEGSSTTDDSSEYTQIPEDFHPLVVARTVLQMTGPEGTQGGFASGRYSELLRELDEEASLMASPQEISQDY